MVESLFHSTLRTVIVRYPDFKKYKKYIKGIWNSEGALFQIRGITSYVTKPYYTAVVRNHMS